MISSHYNTTTTVYPRNKRFMEQMQKLPTKHTTTIQAYFVKQYFYSPFLGSTIVQNCDHIERFRTVFSPYF